MPSIRLTDVIIRNAQPKTGQYTISDSLIHGFGIRISQGGIKSFVVVYGANRQRTTIGKYPIISLSDARAKAKQFLAERTLGRQTIVSITYDDAVGQYLEHCRQNRPKTLRDYAWLLRGFKFSKRTVGDISQQDIMRYITALKNTPTTPKYAFSVARSFFNWAIHNQFAEGNPLAGQKQPNSLSARDRVLSDDELKTLYSHAHQYSYPYGHIILFLILSGQRKNEIASLKWRWIDQEEMMITLPAEITKNKQEHTFPYGALFQKYLATIPEQNEYVFPASVSHVRGKPTTIFNGWSKPLIHHSDRGLQYCSADYQEVLKKNNIQPSMTD